MPIAAFVNKKKNLQLSAEIDRFSAEYTEIFGAAALLAAGFDRRDGFPMFQVSF